MPKNRVGMNKKFSYFLCPIVAGALLTVNCASLRPKPPMLPQYPSPMTERIRQHERIPNQNNPGRSISLPAFAGKTIEIFIPEKWIAEPQLRLLVHFHGASYVARHAVSQQNHPFVLANMNLGSGSSAYEIPFSSEKAFDELIASVEASLRNELTSFRNLEKINLSSFSAGCGAVRAIIRRPENVARIDGIVLLDGLHTDYIPDRTPLADGGSLNTAKLDHFVKFAQLAAEGAKRFIVTHSEIFPGTYASTTETADYLIDALQLKRTPLLTWGPLGMQQVSETILNRFQVAAFAGNTAPDHVDHFHALFHFLSLLDD
ncbi:MAG: hypothetical protein ACOY90_20505 [Candidatus Zhuqueibacterota bacterium]